MFSVFCSFFRARVFDMTQVLHAPAVSDEKRKLPSRPQAPVSEAAACQTPDIPVPPPPEVVLKTELDAAVAQAREAVLAEFREHARTAYEAAFEQGRQDGLKAGHEAGTEEAKRELEGEIQRVRQLGMSLEAAARRQVLGLDDVAVAIAYEAVCKIVGASDVLAGAVRVVVAQATSQAAHSERIVVRAHPDDIAKLQPQAHPAAIGARGGAVEYAGANIVWRPDTGVEAGCVVEIGGAQLDARLTTQLEQLRETLLAARSR